MGQITKAFAKSIVKAADDLKHKPLTCHEQKQLALAWLKLDESGWIACDKRLPVGIDKPLLLYGDHEMLIMGVYNTPSSVFLGWDDVAEDWREFDTRVTHWMEIPATPDGGKANMGVRVEAI